MSEFIESNGIKIVFDIQGQGPALVLLHGAGQTKENWHKAGYVKRLVNDFTVLTIDLRGCGGSDLGYDVAYFAIDQLTSDVQNVVEICEIEEYSIWGYSLGGNIGRYLASQSDQVRALAIIGIPMGAVVHPRFDQFITEFMEKWSGYVEKAQVKPSLAVKSGPKAQIPTMYYLFQAIRGWPKVEANELLCPTMLLCGTRNEGVYEWIQRNQDDLAEAGLQLEFVKGLKHSDEFTSIEKIFPVVSGYFKSQVGGW